MAGRGDEEERGRSSYLLGEKADVANLRMPA